MFQNKSIRYQGLDYEIFWTTQHARHVCSTLHTDRLHDLHHEDMAQLLEHYDAVVPALNNRYNLFELDQPAQLRL